MTPGGFAAIKLTALGPPELLKRMSIAIVEVEALFNKFDKNGGAALPPPAAEGCHASARGA